MNIKSKKLPTQHIKEKDNLINYNKDREVEIGLSKRYTEDIKKRETEILMELDKLKKLYSK